jgi:hypothetical protein
MLFKRKRRRSLPLNENLRLRVNTLKEHGNTDPFHSTSETVRKILLMNGLPMNVVNLRISGHTKNFPET